jgi:hypothetical protein
MGRLFVLPLHLPAQVLVKSQLNLLTLTLAVLSCELSCSGLNGLAVIVAILGAALIAFLFYISMKAIFNPKHKRTKSLSPA